MELSQESGTGRSTAIESEHLSPIRMNLEAIAVSPVGQAHRRIEGFRQDFGLQGFFSFTVDEDPAMLQNKDVRENRHYFLNVMRDENQRRRFFAAANLLQKLQKILPRRRIQAGAGLVQYQEGGSRHQGASNQHALALALGEKKPGPVGQGGAFDLTQNVQSALAIRSSDFAPKIDHGAFAANHRFQRGLASGNHLADGRADQADPSAQLAPVGSSISLRQQLHFAAARSQVAGQRAQERGFARTIGAENGPMFAGPDVPGNFVKNNRGAAPHGQIRNLENGHAPGASCAVMRTFVNWRLAALLLPLTALAQKPPSPLQWPVHPHQMMLVVTKDWQAVDGQLQRYEWNDRGWDPVGPVIQVVVGRRGMAWGRGLHPMPQPGPVKKEGDGKSPAGVFALRSTFGYEPLEKMASVKMPYVQCTGTLECVDDTNSGHYNQILDRTSVPKPDWRSSEHMHMTNGQYRLGIVIEHDTSPPAPGGGSCVFMHIWLGPSRGTSGCTAMRDGDIETIFGWLDSRADPVLIQLPQSEYARLKTAWHLPDIPTAAH